MNNQTLPLPNPDDWISVAGAAAICRISTRTVARRVKAGAIIAHLPYGAADRPQNYILWKPSVLQFGDALAKVRTGATK